MSLYLWIGLSRSEVLQEILAFFSFLLSQVVAVRPEPAWSAEFPLISWRSFPIRVRWTFPVKFLPFPAGSDQFWQPDTVMEFLQQIPAIFPQVPAGNWAFPASFRAEYCVRNHRPGYIIILMGFSRSFMVGSGRTATTWVDTQYFNLAYNHARNWKFYSSLCIIYITLLLRWILNSK